MEKPKPTQSLEQKQEMPEDYVVATFHADADPDVTTFPLTVIRSGQDGKGVRYDGGWIPGDILSVCDTDSEESIGSTELFVKVHKPVKVNGEYVIATKIVSLKKLQSREANKGFNESYIQDLYGKSTEEMVAEGAEAAKQIWRQKHPASEWNELLDVEASPETPSDSLEAEGNSEKSLKDEVSPAMGNLAVKTVEVSPVKTNEVGDNPADLVAIESVEKPIETGEVSTDSVDLPAIEPVEKPMETNEANIDILPEDFKDTINSFERATNDNNDQFFEKAKNITGELNQLRGLIKDNPTAMNNPAVSEMITSTSGRIRDLEASRSESVNKFKNNMNSLLEGLKSEIENEDEKRRRLVKLTEHVDQMGVDDTVLGEVTNGLLDKFTAIRRIIDSSQNDRWGMDGYVDRMISVINGIISDLSTVSGRRRGIVGGIEGIKSEGYYQKR